MAFTDDFNRANEDLETSANWTRVDGVAGALKVISNQCGEGSGGDAAYLCPDQSDADHYTQAVLNGASGPASSFPVCVRVTDKDNWIGVRYSTGGMELYKRVAGTFTSLDTSTHTHSAGDVWYLEASGNNIVGKLNGTTVVSATETDHNTVTRQGIINRGVENPLVDDFEAGALVSPPVITSEPAVVRPSGTGYELGGTFPNTGTSTATLVMDGTTSVSCTITGLTATTLTFSMPAAPASLFDATGFTFTFTDDSSNADTSAVVPYDPPTTHDFITLTSIAGTNADFTFGYSGATVASGKQVVYETPTPEIDALAIVVSADCSYTLEEGLTQNNTSDYYVIDADGTIGVTDTNTFLFSAPGGSGNNSGGFISGFGNLSLG